jgi:hypothetical protein
MPERAQLNIWKQLYPDQTKNGERGAVTLPFLGCPVQNFSKGKQRNQDFPEYLRMPGFQRKSGWPAGSTAGDGKQRFVDLNIQSGW